jgi:hypothetical protein
MTKTIRLADPYHFNEGPDTAFNFNANTDPAFNFNVDSNPAPHQSDGNLRPLVCRPSRAPY